MNSTERSKGNNKGNRSAIDCYGDNMRQDHGIPSRSRGVLGKIFTGAPQNDPKGSLFYIPEEPQIIYKGFKNFA